MSAVSPESTYLTENVICVDSRNPGPTVIIIAGTHGNEQAPVTAMTQTIPLLNLTNGRVFFLYGNPRAILRNVSFTGMNLNRAFNPERIYTAEEQTTYEFKRSLIIKELMREQGVKALLDLHASPARKSVPFGICEVNGYDIMRRMPVEYIVSGFDRYEPGGTDHGANAAGITGLCVEVGNRYSPYSVGVAQMCIFSLLAHFSMIEAEPPLMRDVDLLELYTTHKTRVHFKPAREIDDFERLEMNDVVGEDGGDKIRVPSNQSYALFVAECKDVGDEAFVLARKICAPWRAWHA